jgi:hypothetical protein
MNGILEKEADYLKIKYGSKDIKTNIILYLAIFVFGLIPFFILLISPFSVSILFILNYIFVISLLLSSIYETFFFFEISSEDITISVKVWGWNLSSRTTSYKQIKALHSSRYQSTFIQQNDRKFRISHIPAEVNNELITFFQKWAKKMELSYEFVDQR